MTVSILLFGHYRDYLPASERVSAGSVPIMLDLPDDGATPVTVAARLAERDARFADLPTRTRVAVRADFAAWDTPLADGDEIAFLPPMSGG